MGVLDKVTRWASRPELRARYAAIIMEHVGDACERYGIEPEDLDQHLGERLYNLDGWMFEDLLTAPDEDGETVIENYLRRRGFQETATNRAFLTALNRAAIGIYEIVEVRSGEGLTLRDAIEGGEPFKVTERAGSRTLKLWDYLAARVIPVRGDLQLAGGILPIPLDWAPALILELKEKFELAKDQVRAMFDADNPAPEGLDVDALSMSAFLSSAASIISDFWTDRFLSRVLGEDRPMLITSDGDPLALTTATFSFKPKTKLTEVKARLAKIQALERIDRAVWAWAVKDGEVARQANESGLVVESWLEPGVFELASVRVEKRSIVVEAKSTERSAWAARTVAEALEGLVDEPVIMVTTADDLLDRSREPSAAEPFSASPEAEAFRRQWIADHYAAQLDLPIPMLGNKSPRVLSRTAEGRELLVPWLKGVENSIAKMELEEPLDIAWLWAELGMLDERR